MNKSAIHNSQPAIKLAVINPGMGNLRSVCNAWEQVGAKVELVAHADEVGEPDALVFPGQGAVVDCMHALQETGLDEVIKKWINNDKPFFGICLGLQALFDFSAEGNTPGLGIFAGRVERFQLEPGFKIPHMGWNCVRFKGERDVLLEGIRDEDDQFYFVHSYHVVTHDPDLIWCETDYGYPFTSGIRRGNCFATQFHPEKSQAKGLQMYRNFLQWIILHK